MGQPETKLDYNEVDDICSSLEEWQSCLDGSQIHYDENSTVTCNHNAQDCCADEYKLRQEVLDKVNDTSTGIANYEVAFKDLELNLQGKVFSIDKVTEQDGTVSYNRDTLGY